MDEATDLSQVFKDFKEVIQIHRFATPLQRAHRRQQQQSAQFLSQKQLQEAQQVHFLLPPGHYTQLKVDFCWELRKWRGRIEVKIPVTMTAKGGKIWVMYTCEKGSIETQSHLTLDTAFRHFSSLLHRTSSFKPNTPKYVLKLDDSSPQFFPSLALVRSHWLSTPASHYQLQQYIAPHTKAATLVRAHWKSSQQSATCYFIYQDHVTSEQRLSCVLDQVPTLFNRSHSENTLPKQGKTTSKVVIQRSKLIPELDNAVKDCVKVVQNGLIPGESVSEAVFDFVSNQKHQWVVLGCKGYTRNTKERRVKIATFEQKTEINMKFLLYPLLARKSIIHKKINHSVFLSSVAFRRRKGIIPSETVTQTTSKVPLIAKTTESVLPVLDTTSRSSSVRSTCPCPMLSKTFFTNDSLPRRVITQEVSKYDNMREYMRKNQEIAKNKQDFVEKYGGMQFWLPQIQFLISEVLKNSDYGNYFEEIPNIEECSFIIHCFSRIIRGNYNFYYKETLGKLHSKCGISLVHFDSFLKGIEAVLMGVEISRGDSEEILRRFRELKDYICAKN